MKKRLLSIFLAALMLLTLLPTVALATEPTNWSKLDSAMKGEAQASVTDVFAVENDTPEIGIRTITLLTDITAGGEDTYLTVAAGKTIVLDLNGHTLDRGLSGKAAATDGNAIVVNGNLTIQDSSKLSNGMITGGNTSNWGGGGICVRDGGMLTLESGAITGNKSAKSGGGVFLACTAKFTMTGGMINQNHTDNGGGGVFCHSDFTLTDGEIASNTSLISGAGVYVHGDDKNKGNGITKHFTMTGGSIKNNISSDKGGGVYADNYDMDAQLLGGVISDNSAAKLGGGVCCNAPITVGAKIQITGNTVNKAANNVQLRNETKSEFNPVIKISTPTDFTGKKQVGVTLEGDKGAILESCTSSGVANFFFADDRSTELVYDKSTNSLVMQPDNSVLSKVTKLLAVAVSTTIAVRSITGAVKLVVGVPAAMAIAPQVIRTLGRIVFRHRF